MNIQPAREPGREPGSRRFLAGVRRVSLTPVSEILPRFLPVFNGSGRLIEHHKNIVIYGTKHIFPPAEPFPMMYVMLKHPHPPAPLPEGEGSWSYSKSVLPEMIRTFSGRMCKGNFIISWSSFKISAGRGVG